MNITLILALVSIIAQNQYCLHQQGCFRYSCGDFTKDTVILLRMNNITAYPICNGIHYWVGVELEAKYYNWVRDGYYITCRNGYSICTNGQNINYNKLFYGNPNGFLIDGKWVKSNLIQIEPQTGTLITSNEGIYKRGRHCVARGLW